MRLPPGTSSLTIEILGQYSGDKVGIATITQRRVDVYAYAPWLFRQLLVNNAAYWGGECAPDTMPPALIEDVLWMMATTRVIQ